MQKKKEMVLLLRFSTNLTNLCKNCEGTHKNNEKNKFNTEPEHSIKAN
jgi:phage replication-related protein YjqB (UPF0714/DUF867 family)